MHPRRTRLFLGIATALVVAACASDVPMPAVSPTAVASPSATGPASAVPVVTATPTDSPTPTPTTAPTPTPTPVPTATPTPRPTAAPTAAPPGPAVAMIAHGPRDRRVIALTFDADMTSGMLAQLRSGAVASWYEARIVATLREAKVPATVFLTGLWTQAYADVVRSLAADPLFELENHSMDHAAWRTPCYGLPFVSTDAARRAELTNAATAIHDIAGVEPAYFRYPGGCHAGSDDGLVAALGERALDWDVVSGDAFQANPDVVVNQVLARVQPGSIVVMHFIGAPNAPATANALDRLIPLLRAQGYGFATVRDLLYPPAP